MCFSKFKLNPAKPSLNYPGSFPFCVYYLKCLRIQLNKPFGKMQNQGSKLIYACRALINMPQFDFLVLSIVFEYFLKNKYLF